MNSKLVIKLTFLGENVYICSELYIIFDQSTLTPT
jgi:hypothetical protein